MKKASLVAREKAVVTLQGLINTREPVVEEENGRYQAGTCYSTFQCPDLPPSFSITLTSLITMPRSMALHMS